MENITTCLNEWNATLEALGQGKQTILIRKYNTSVDNFFLYPTVSYVKRDENFFKSFKNEYQSFAKKYSLPKVDGKRTEVKYFANVHKVFEKSSQRIKSLNKYHIWTNEHVRSYLNNKKGYVWILRVYKLNKPVMAKRTMGINYSNLLENVSLEDIKPVLSVEKFSKIVNEIK